MDFGQLFILLLWAPSIISGIAFVISAFRELRQIKNAIYLLILLLWTSLVLLFFYGQQWPFRIILFVAMLALPVTVVMFFSSGVGEIRKRGFSLATIKPILIALLIVAALAGLPLCMALDAPGWLSAVFLLISLETAWFCFGMAIFLLYMWIYRHLPSRRSYDYIVVPGTDLVGSDSPKTLENRLDRVVELWTRQGRTGSIVVSGGQAARSAGSRAVQMRNYLTRHGVPKSRILVEGKSTTAWESLANSKAVMDKDAGDDEYSCAVVTSDYRVPHYMEYARSIGLGIEGVGCKTKSQHRSTVLIREFLAVSRNHLGFYIAIVFLWAPVVVVLLFM